jgi:hypothetical protein
VWTAFWLAFFLVALLLIGRIPAHDPLFLVFLAALLAGIAIKSYSGRNLSSRMRDFVRKRVEEQSASSRPR